MTTTSPATASTTTPPADRSRALSALRRRWPTGLGVAATAIALALLAPLPDPLQLYVSAWCVLLAAVIYLTWGVVRGHLQQRRPLMLQVAAVLGFGAIALAATAVDGTVALYVLAAGWLCHATWDVAHHRADRVVPRWYAETCLVADVIVAGSLLALAQL
jgi:uncharacterized protein YhhL (DUF1145 family)